MRDANARIWCRSLGNYSVAPQETISAARTVRIETMLCEEFLATEKGAPTKAAIVRIGAAVSILQQRQR